MPITVLSGRSATPLTSLRGAKRSTAAISLAKGRSVPATPPDAPLVDLDVGAAAEKLPDANQPAQVEEQDRRPTGNDEEDVAVGVAQHEEADSDGNGCPSTGRVVRRRETLATKAWSDP